MQIQADTYVTNYKTNKRGKHCHAHNRKIFHETLSLLIFICRFAWHSTYVRMYVLRTMILILLIIIYPQYFTFSLQDCTQRICLCRQIKHTYLYVRVCLSVMLSVPRLVCHFPLVLHSKLKNCIIIDNKNKNKKL